MYGKIAETIVVSFGILVLLAGVGEPYSGLIPADPENQGKCVYRGDTLKAGMNSGIAPCQQLTCNEDGSILIEGCGKLRLPNCNRGERINTEKPYPECCMLRYKCKKPDGSAYYIDKNVYDGLSTTINST